MAFTWPTLDLQNRTCRTGPAGSARRDKIEPLRKNGMIAVAVLAGLGTVGVAAAVVYAEKKEAIELKKDKQYLLQSQPYDFTKDKDGLERLGAAKGENLINLVNAGLGPGAPADAKRLDVDLVSRLTTAQLNELLETEETIASLDHMQGPVRNALFRRLAAQDAQRANSGDAETTTTDPRVAAWIMVLTGSEMRKTASCVSVLRNLLDIYSKNPLPEIKFSVKSAVEKVIESTTLCNDAKSPDKKIGEVFDLYGSAIMKDLRAQTLSFVIGAVKNVQPLWNMPEVKNFNWEQLNRIYNYNQNPSEGLKRLMKTNYEAPSRMYAFEGKDIVEGSYSSEGTYDVGHCVQQPVAKIESVTRGTAAPESRDDVLAVTWDGDKLITFTLSGMRSGDVVKVKVACTRIFDIKNNVTLKLTVP